MQELSMNVLDIAENSVAAGSTLTRITLQISTSEKLLTLIVEDNGRGMSPQLQKNVIDPFTTTRSTRRVGMGLPLLKMAAEQTGGGLSIESVPGEGTTVTATFTLGHIDLMPIGDIPSTISALIQCNPDVDFIFTASTEGDSFTADTRQMRSILGPDVSFSLPQVALWIREYLAENTEKILKRSMVL